MQRTCLAAALALALCSPATFAKGGGAAQPKSGAQGKPKPGGGASAECSKPSRAIPGANECTVRPPADCVAPAGGGKLIAAKSKVYEAQRDITVYRVYGLYDAPLSGGNRLTGAWWTLGPPTETTRDDYASNYAVCRDWNAMKHVVKCKLKKGARFVYGDGQSLFTSTCKASAQMPVPSKWHKQIGGKTAVAPPAQYKQVCISGAGNRVFYREAGHMKPVYQSAAGVNMDVECEGHTVKNPVAVKFTN